MDISVKNHTAGDFCAVARLHSENINKGFLSSLGIPFLTLLYRAIDLNENSVLLVAKEDGAVVGFTSATAGMGSIYRQLLAQFPRVLWSLLPSLRSPARIYKILEIMLLTKNAQLSAALPHEELLSIVVAPSHLGKGLSEKLFRELCEYFRDRNVNGFHIVVGDSLSRAHSFYLKMGSEFVGKIEVHKGENSTVYFKDCGNS